MTSWAGTRRLYEQPRLKREQVRDVEIVLHEPPPECTGGQSSLPGAVEKRVVGRLARHSGVPVEKILRSHANAIFGGFEYVLREGRTTTGAASASILVALNPVKSASSYYEFPGDAPIRF